MVRDIEDRLRVDSGHDRRQVLDAFQSWSGNLAVLHQVRSVAGKLLLWCRIRPEWWNRRLAGRARMRSSPNGKRRYPMG
ncbi:hypothetical protein ACWDUL_10715 [Nocardia niigatensis]|uniref:hypothetical protein n=1 Tax=Nocardia niigatensis TaxID=209249 RepID=UPI0002E8127B|nr:hypothetical protein [Nocardia niigatensis]